MNNTESFEEVLRTELLCEESNDTDKAVFDRILSAHTAARARAVEEASAQRDKECREAGHIILRGEAAKKFAAQLTPTKSEEKK